MNASSTDIGVSSAERILKRVYRVGNRTLILIDESLVNLLSIEEDTWFEQQVIDNGIIMRIHSDGGRTKEDAQIGDPRIDR